MAYPFVLPSGSNYTFTDAKLALSQGIGLNNAVDISLALDASDQPGAVLESFHLVNALGPAGANNPPVAVTSVLNPRLLGGVQYWLIELPSFEGGGVNWLTATLVPTPPQRAVRLTGNSGWTVATVGSSNGPGAFSIEGNVLGTSNDPATFVTQQYLDLLGRPPDPNGLQFWIGQLNSGFFSRSQLAYQFFTSAEFQQVGQLVISAYIAVLGRDPDIVGWQSWVNGIHHGLSAYSLIDSFVRSPEFLNTYGNLDDTAFITRVYLNVLGRAPDPGGLAYWLGALSAGQNRSQVMYGFANGLEFQRLIRNRSLAILMYMGFLRRSPDPIGEAFWVESLNQGLTPEQVVSSFLTSPEYLRRF